MWSSELWIRVVNDDKQGAAVCTARKMERGLNVLVAHRSCATELPVELFILKQRRMVALFIPNMFPFTGSD